MYSLITFQTDLVSEHEKVRILFFENHYVHHLCKESASY